MDGIHVVLADSLMALGRSQEAVAVAEKGTDLMNRSPRALCRLGAALARTGEQTRAREVLGELEHQPTPWVLQSSHPFHVHLALGDKPAALACLERAYTEHDPDLAAILTWLLSDELRGEPAFQALRRKLGLPV